MKKKLIGILICTVLMISVFAVGIGVEESEIKEKIEIIVFSEPNEYKDNQYINLKLKEANTFLIESGKPILPVYSKILKFPFGTEIKGFDCTPIQVNKKVIYGEVQPSPKPVLSENINDALENTALDSYLIKDETVYNNDNFYPNKWFDYQIGSGLDGTDHVVFLVIRFYPVQYSPGQNLIRYASSAEIKVQYSEPTYAFNFPDEFDMVIIAPSEFSEDLQPLVDYKNDGIIKTIFVSLDDIYSGTYFPVQGRDDQEKIKYFIKDAIENWGITYVLLAGGTNKVPVRIVYVPDGHENSYISDLYYADVYDKYGEFCSWDSNENDIFGEFQYQGRTDVVDLYPDVHLGRLNFRSINEVSPVVNKIITYESTGAYLENWFKNFIVIGGDSFQDSGNVDEGEYLNQHALDIMDDFNAVKIWATNGKLNNAANIDDAIEDGSGFIYFSGHGTFESWATHPHNDFETWIPYPFGYIPSMIENLNNQRKLPIIIIGGCSNSKFSEDVCFGWSFLKNPNGGGIASYGNSALGWQYVGASCPNGLSGARELKMFRSYKYQNAETTGEMWSMTLTSYINDYGKSSSHNIKTIEEWQPFCDPSMRFVKISDKPDKPDTPDGPTSGGKNIKYSYTTKTTEPNGDYIKYCFDWGDGTVSWTDWMTPGQSVSMDHIWDSPGYYKIKAKARDEYGLDSVWSDSITMHIQGEIIEIKKISGGFFKVNAIIKNIGDVEVPDVEWSIKVKGGILGFIDVFTKGTLDSTLLVNDEEKVTSDSFIGLGKITITLWASSPNSNVATKTATGLIFGPIILVF